MSTPLQLFALQIELTYNAACVCMRVWCVCVYV